MKGDTFNSQVKTARSPTKKYNKRGKINQDPKGQPSPENLDQIIKEFAKIDIASAAVTKGFQQTKDAATEIEKNEMSPIRAEQLRDDVRGKAIGPDQRELLRLLGVLDQAEAKVMRIAERAEAMIEQHYKKLNYAATAEAAADQHLLPVTLDESYDDDILIGGFENWQDIDLQMTLDSGCCKHVLPADAAPGYEVSDSPGSKRGQSFTVGKVPKSPMKAKCY